MLNDGQIYMSLAELDDENQQVISIISRKLEEIPPKELEGLNRDLLCMIAGWNKIPFSTRRMPEILADVMDLRVHRISLLEDKMREENASKDGANATPKKSISSSAAGSPADPKKDDVPSEVDVDKKGDDGSVVTHEGGKSIDQPGSTGGTSTRSAKTNDPPAKGSPSNSEKKTPATPSGFPHFNISQIPSQANSTPGPFVTVTDLNLWLSEFDSRISGYFEEQLAEARAHFGASIDITNKKLDQLIHERTTAAKPPATACRNLNMEPEFVKHPDPAPSSSFPTYLGKPITGPVPKLGHKTPSTRNYQYGKESSKWEGSYGAAATAGGNGGDDGSEDSSSDNGPPQDRDHGDQGFSRSRFPGRFGRNSSSPPRHFGPPSPNSPLNDTLKSDLFGLYLWGRDRAWQGTMI
jgi:hypothetical protein